MYTKFVAVASLIFAMFVGATAQGLDGKDAKSQYPSMAPLDQYLMDREAEIALSRSAAPNSISHDAKVVVLTPHGYETAAEGKNGFVCLVGGDFVQNL